MNNYTKVTMLSAALAVFLLPVSAQTTSAPANTTSPAVSTAPATTAPSSTPPASTSTTQQKTETSNQINGRKENQQDRIANGISNGSLTPSESSNLENKETKINQEEQQMKQQDNGHLTAADRATLQQQQNAVSKQIYQDKHNATKQPATTGVINQHAENQQDRIAQGVKDGQLSANQTRQLEGDEAKINRENQQDRAANGGRLTPQEKAQLRQQQNNVSHQIHADRHKPKAAK